MGAIRRLSRMQIYLMGMSGTSFTAQLAFGLGIGACLHRGHVPVAVCGSPQGNLTFLYPVAGAVGAVPWGKKSNTALSSPNTPRIALFQNRDREHHDPPHGRGRIFTVFLKSAKLCRQLCLLAYIRVTCLLVLNKRPFVRA